MDIKLGKRWKDIRNSLGLTQEIVSEELNMGIRYVSDLERDVTLGSIPVLIKLCNIYQTTPTIILQDYLDIKDDYKIPPELVDFHKLNNRDKKLVLNLIKEMKQTKE